MWPSAVRSRMNTDIANHQLQPSQSALSWLITDIVTMTRDEAMRPTSTLLCQSRPSPPTTTSPLFHWRRVYIDNHISDRWPPALTCHSARSGSFGPWPSGLACHEEAFARGSKLHLAWPRRMWPTQWLLAYGTEPLRGPGLGSDPPIQVVQSPSATKPSQSRWD